MSIDDAKATMVEIIRTMRAEAPDRKNEIEEYEDALEAASSLTDAPGKVIAIDVRGGCVNAVRANFVLPDGARIQVVDYDCMEGVERKLTDAIGDAFVANMTTILY